MRRRFRRAFRVGDAGQELDEELAYHRTRTVAELEAAGLTRSEAEAEAVRRFGDATRWRRELERQGRLSRARATVLERVSAGVDIVRFALRSLRRRPGLSLGIVLTFALGVGVNAVMFDVVDRLLFRAPAHLEAPVELRRVLVERQPMGAFSTFGPGASRPRTASEVMTYPDVGDLEEVESLAGVAAYHNREMVLGRGAEAVEVRGVLATGGYFETLGVRPDVGRLFGAEEDRFGGAPVAVISHGLWQRLFGGDPGAVGALLDLNLPAGPFEVIGVAPRGFTGMDPARVDVWLPLLAAHPSAETFTRSRNWYFLRVTARLAPGRGPEVAAAEATLAHRRGRAESIEEGRYDPAPEVVLAPVLAARGPLATQESVVARWLAGVSLLVLLIACANVANLLLARAARRRRETAVRLALGVTRRRLAGETLVEGLALALAGGAAALVAARWGGSVVHGLLLPDVAPPDGLHGRVVAFTAIMAALAGMAASVLPIVQAGRDEVAAALRAGGRGSVGVGASRLRNSLSGLQAALSVVLLVGAGLFLHSLERISALDLGIEPAGLVMVVPMGDDLTAADRRLILERTKARLVGDGASGPIVAASATGGSSPFWSEIVSGLRLPGADSLPEIAGGYPRVHTVDGDYFRTMGLALEAGRGIQSGDVEGAAPVVVVNAVMARALWPGQSPIGECIHVEDGPCAEVVGVVEDAVIGRVPEEPAAQYYVAMAQGLVDTTPTTLMVRLAPGAEASAYAAIRAAVAESDPRIRHASIVPMPELIEPYTRAWTLGASLFSAFGLLALLVAGIGLYSILAYEVAQRRPEIGIRAALGAARARIVRDVVRRAMGVALPGLAAGLVAAILLGPYVDDLLYETSPRDPATLSVVVVVLLAVAVGAAAAPALRASRVDPNEALRSD